MTSAYILIAAILLLGGMIAALGDRLGTKVGKARLRLFGLRPRQTAVVMTIITGTVISASTLGVLFATSESLRQGVFELDEILKRRRDLKQELQQITDEKEGVEEAFVQAKSQQTEAQEELDQINQNLQKTQAQLKSIAKQGNKLRTEIKGLRGEQLKLLQQRTQLQKQTNQLQEQLKERDRKLAQREQTIAEREQEIASQDRRLEQQNTKISAQQKSVQELEDQRISLTTAINRLQEQTQVQDEKIQQLDEAIEIRDRALANRESQRQKLEQQLGSLQREVSILERFYQLLRQGKFAFGRGQILAFGTIQARNPEEAREEVYQLLEQANRVVIEANPIENPAPEQFALDIPVPQLEQLIDRLQDGQNYLVRILSAGNYLEGETPIQVFANLELNQILFEKEEVIATLPLNPQGMTSDEIQQQLELLLASSQFRARRAGVLTGIQIEDNTRSTLFNFLSQLQNTELDEIQAIALETTYTVGPLKLKLIGLQNGEIVLST